MPLLVCTFLRQAIMPVSTSSASTTAKVSSSSSGFPAVGGSTACEDAGQFGEHEIEGGPDDPDGSDCRFAAIDAANQGKATTIVAKSPICTACLNE